MKRLQANFLLLLILLACLGLAGAAERPRLAVLTDIGGDPDDTQSLIRLMAYANERGGLYPVNTWTDPNPHGCLKEGDTPSWFFFLPAGGNDPNDPSKPGWGGQYQREADGWWRDLSTNADFDPRTTVSKWRPSFQADFARRMKWCVE
jgi:hypothetical protein